MSLPRFNTARLGALTAVALVLSLHVFPAMAQLPADAERAATGTASPGRVQQQLEDQGFTSSVSPRVDVKSPILQTVPEGAENIRFNLNTVSLEGVTAYSAGDLRAIYADQLGQNISLADLYAISTALTNRYRNDGYILTQVIVPPQTIEGGNVKLNVIEGYVDSVSVQGNDQTSALNLIRRYAGAIRTGKALNIADLERHLLLINDLPGIEARSVLSPSKSTSGASDLRIIIERDPYDALLAVDNFGSRYLGPLQGSAAGSANSFFGNNERITAQVVTAADPGEIELGYFALSYSQPIPDIGLGLGTSVELSASHTDTEPGYDLNQFDVEGRSQLFSAKLRHPFIRSRASNLYGHLGFDWRDVESKNNLEETRRDRIRALRVGGRYEFLDTLIGVGINSLSAEVSQGLDLLGSSDKGDVRLTRAAGDPTFTKINVDGQRLQRVTSNVNLLLAARGQLSNNPLLSSEEFGVGGIGFGRGYDPSEIVGDDGVAGKIEVQWNEPTPWSFVQDYQLYSFYDAGRVWNQDATTSSLKSDTIHSAGAGIRMDFMDATEAGLAFAFPLNRDVQTQKDRDPRVYFNLSREF